VAVAEGDDGSMIGRREILRAVAGLSVPSVLTGRSVAMTPPLTVLTRDTEAIGGPAIRHGRSFAAATGVTVDVIRIPFDQLYDQLMVGFITGRSGYDVVIVPSPWLPDLAPYLAPVPDWMHTADAFSDIYPAYRDVMMRWQGAWKALTIDGDLQIGAYRADLFDDPAHQRVFAEAYGQVLGPPETWEDYRRIAEYFHGHQDADGRTLAGTVEPFMPKGQRLWTLCSRAAAYVNHPAQRGAMFFDPDTMTPAIDNPGWVRALSEYVAVRAFAPADAARMDSYEVRTRFVAGRSAMNIDWTDTGVLAADPAISTVVGRVGFFGLPGSRDVWNPLTRRWDDLGRTRHVPFIAFGGWVAAVPAGRGRIDDAWRYVAWFGDPARSAVDVMDGTSGINPYRYSHLADVQPWLRVFGSKERAAAYLDVIRSSLESPDAVNDLRIPGFRAYAAAMDAAIEAALTNAATPGTALGGAAAAWERITDRLGRQGQRRHYRQAMGLDG
jgi:ABC-type sugar transport system, periplasmic component